MNEELLLLHKTYNVKVQFKTYSDALIAKLSLQLGWRADDIDLLLDVVHDPRFDRKDLTIRKTNDIEERVAEYRKERADLRSSGGLAMTGSMPDIVRDLVLVEIREELDSRESFMGFPDITDASLRRGLPDETNARMLLKNISLVHRTWTKPAQDILRSRVYLGRPSSIARFLSSLKAVEQVRELQDWHMEFSNIFNKAEEEMDVEPLMRILYGRLSNLRALSISIGRPDTDAVLSPLDFMLPGSSLRSLHVHGIWTCCSLTKLCEVITNMPRLSVLSIIGHTFWDDTNAADYSLPDYILSPPPSLTKLLFSYYCLGGRTLPEKILTWLFRPRGDYALRELRLHVHKDHSEPHAFRTLISPLSCALGPSLETLVLHLNLPRETSYTDIVNLIHTCSSLRHLHLHADQNAEIPTFSLPSSLETLHISGMRNGHRAGLVDQRIKNWLSTLFSAGDMPQRCKIYIPRAVMHDDAETPKLCELHGLAGQEDPGPGWTWRR